MRTLLTPASAFHLADVVPDILTYRSRIGSVSRDLKATGNAELVDLMRPLVQETRIAFVRCIRSWANSKAFNCNAVSGRWLYISTLCIRGG